MTRTALTKAAGIVALLTVISRILGFVRETSLAGVFGATYASDAYLMAQAVPLLLFAVVSNAISTTFIPVYSQVREERGQREAVQMANTVIRVVFALAVVLVIAGQLLARPMVGLVAPGFEGPVAELTVYLTRIILPMMVFQLLSGVITGILHAHGEFGIPTAAALVQNVFIIVAILFFGPRFGIAAVAVGLLLGVGGSLAAKLLALGRTGFRWQRVLNLREPGLRRMMVLMVPAIVSAGSNQINRLVDRILASGLPEGRVSALNYAARLEALVPGILGTSIATVMYPTLSRFAAQRDWKRFADGLVNALGVIHFLLAPVAVGLMVLRVPLVRIVYERGAFDAAATQETAWALLFLGAGVAFISMRDLVSRAFFALQDTTTPMLIGLATVAVNIVLNLLLVGPLEQGGLALATSIAGLFGLVLSIGVIRRKAPRGLPLRRLLDSVARTLLAAAAMGAAVWWVYPLMELLLSRPGTLMELGRVAVVAGLGAAIYIAIAWILRVPELSFGLDILRRALGRVRPHAAG